MQSKKQKKPGQKNNLNMAYKIKFSFEDGSDPITVNDVEADNSILEVALDNEINLHCQCGGVCACSTCHSYVEKGMEHFEEKSYREITFLKDALDPKENSRLSCQCILLEGEGDIEVTIPDQSKIEE